MNTNIGDTPLGLDSMPAGRPNIVLVVSDDHGYADLGRTGTAADVSTPALNRLMVEGTSCSQAYVTAPICSPSRAALISGRHQARWGATWFDDSSFGDAYRTIAEELRDLGYTTGYFGKVHYGKEEIGDRACPPHHGFDSSYYGLAGKQEGRLHYLHHSNAARIEYGDEGARRMGMQPMIEGDVQVEFDGFLTKEIGERARDFMRRSTSQQPFFVMVAFNAVHNYCWQLPVAELAARGLPTVSDWRGEDVMEYLEWYDGVIALNLAYGREYYAAQLELMDREIGLLLRQLEISGQADNTLVIYLTDNGGSTCNYGDNAPLAGTKYTLWEGGIRVPLLFRWLGGGIPAGVQCKSQVVSALDLLPTIVSAAGGTMTASDLDGFDLLPILRGQMPSFPRCLYWECGFQWGIRSDDFKLVYVEPESKGAQGVRTVEHAEPGSGFRLFDLENDMREHRDLTAERADVVERLKRLFEEWRETTSLGVIDREHSGLDPNVQP